MNDVEMFVKSVITELLAVEKEGITLGPEVEFDIGAAGVFSQVDKPRIKFKYNIKEKEKLDYLPIKETSPLYRKTVALNFKETKCRVCGEKTTAEKEEDGWTYCSPVCIKIKAVEDEMNNLYMKTATSDTETIVEVDRLERRVLLLESEVRSLLFYRDKNE